eukprot:s7238_g3.t1
MLASLPRVPPWSYTKEVAQTAEDQGRNGPGNPEGIGKNWRGARTAYDYVKRRKRQRIYSDVGKAELRSYELRVDERLGEVLEALEGQAIAVQDLGEVVRAELCELAAHRADEQRRDLSASIEQLQERVRLLEGTSAEVHRGRTEAGQNPPP